MKLILITLSTIVALSHGFSLTSNEWISFKSTFNKQYANKVEEDMRLRIFTKNVEEINEHNKKFELGLSTYERGINHLTDMTLEEIKTKMMGLRVPENQVEREGIMYVADKMKAPPKEIDWRNVSGVVTPVKDQGACGSCWAFSSTGGIEGQYFLKYKKSVSLSEQNLVDCDPQSFGCGGGWMNWAYDYVIKNKGIDTEEGYPYKATRNSCQYTESAKGAEISNYAYIEKNNEEDLKQAVADVGPIPIAFDAGHNSFQAYRSGIWDEKECRVEVFTHAVLVVGYGTDNGTDYWLVKNSWSTGWGMDGYFKMRRNNGNQCGVAGHALYPII